MKTLDPANLQGIRDDMDLYDRIRDKISGLTSVLKDMNTLTPEMHEESNFSILYDAIEKRMKESSTISPAKIAKDMNTTEGIANTADNVKATNGSIGASKIEIGGDMSGNIVIGNNNQVNDGRGKKK